MADSVLFITDSDSNVKFAANFSGFLQRDYAIACRVIFIGNQFRFLKQAANFIPERISVDVVSCLSSLYSKKLLNYDVICPLITGKYIKEFCENLNRLALTYGVPKPVTIGGFIGEWISAKGQVAERGALDIFVVNRADELNKFREICARDSHGTKFVSLPYAFLLRHDFARPLAASFNYDLKKMLVFADQVQVPRTDTERLFLYQYLLRLAKQSPERNIYFCSREIEGGATRHNSLSGIIDHVGEDLRSISNLIVEAGTFQQRLSEADLVVSVSSTAGIEALINGVPAVFLRGFSSSGAEKFAGTGLLIDVFELEQPKTFTLAPDFYAEIGRQDVWVEFAKLVRSQPACGTNARPARRMVQASLISDPSAAGKYQKIVYEVMKLDRVEERTVEIPQTPIDLSAVVRNTEANTLALAPHLRVSDVIRLPSPLPHHIVVTTVLQSARASSADVRLTTTELSVHVPKTLEKDDRIEIDGAIYGEPVKISVGAEIETAFSDSCAIQVICAAYATGETEITVVRLRSFLPITIEGIHVFGLESTLLPSWIAYQNSFLFSKICWLSPMLATRTIELPTRDFSGIISVLRFERELFDHFGPLFTWVDAEGRTLQLALHYGHRMSLALADGDQTIHKHVRCKTLAVSVVIITTTTMTLVMLNENLCVFERIFIPTRIEVNEASASLAISLAQLFAANVTLLEANRLIELILLKFYGDRKYAKKHRPVPDFRPVVETKLALSSKPTDSREEAASATAKPKVPPATAKPQVPPATAKPQVPPATAKPQVPPATAKPKIPPATAKPKIPPATAKPKIPPATAKPKVPPATAKPQVPPATAKPQVPPATRARAAQGGQDQAAGLTIRRVNGGLLVQAKAHMKAGDWAAALDVSNVALSRKPDATAHMRIAARALRYLGRLDEADHLLKQARRLLPQDRRLQREHRMLKQRIWLRRVGSYLVPTHLRSAQALRRRSEMPLNR